MPPFLRRAIITAWVVLALGTFMYFTATRSEDPILKLVVIFGGCGVLFIMIKAYLFRS